MHQQGQLVFSSFFPPHSSSASKGKRPVFPRFAFSSPPPFGIPPVISPIPIGLSGPVSSFLPPAALKGKGMKVEGARGRRTYFSRFEFPHSSSACIHRGNLFFPHFPLPSIGKGIRRAICIPRLHSSPPRAVKWRKNRKGRG
jgi:hypothetical protein